MGTEGSIYGFLGTQHYIGVSQVIGITVIPGLLAMTVKHSGGGTLWSGGATVSVGNGYLVSTGEALNIDSRGTLYFTSAGATSTIHILRGRTSGFED